MTKKVVIEFRFPDEFDTEWAIKKIVTHTVKTQEDLDLFSKISYRVEVE